MSQDAKQRGLIKSDETLLRILEVLKEEGTAGVTELATEMDLAKSTVHKHLATMKEHRFVVQEGTEYRLSYRFLDYGVSVRNASDVFLVAKPKIDELANELSERVYLVSEEHGMVIVVYANPDEARPTTYARMGHQKFLHQTSGGKAMLAHFSAEKIDAILDRHGLPAATDQTITDRETLLDELETIRSRGYAINEEESIRGLSGIAAPIIGPENEVRGAVCIGVLAKDELEETVRERLLRTINEIEIDLAFS